MSENDASAKHAATLHGKRIVCTCGDFECASLADISEPLAALLRLYEHGLRAPDIRSLVEGDFETVRGALTSPIPPTKDGTS